MTSRALAPAMLLAVVAVPLLFAAALLRRDLRPVVSRVAPLAPLPAIVLGAVGADGVAVEASWMLLGVRLGAPDLVARGFLVLGGVVFCAAAVYAHAYLWNDEHRHSFWLYFLLTAAGALGVAVAGDVATFYTLYALMTFAAYGLVLHDRTHAARRAGRVYIAMAVGGEAVLLLAFVTLVRDRSNLPLAELASTLAVADDREIVAALALAGFGVKAGLVPLHLWLPLAHPVAPIPASAVLSGALIACGALGWLRFLPLGAVAMPRLGLFCAAAGVASALYGAVMGVTQGDPKTVLAYSSVSQMGFAAATVGAAMTSPSQARAAIAATTFFLLQHALAKSALFLGVGVASRAGSRRSRRLVAGGLVVPALAIAGAPLTSGALAKAAIKPVLASVPAGAAVLGGLLSVAAIGSTLLMARVVALVTRPPVTEGHEPERGLWIPWLALVVAQVASLAAEPFRPLPLAALLEPASVVSAAWPIAIGLAIAATTARALARRPKTRLPSIPPGDLVVPLGAALERARRAGVAAQTRARRLARAIRTRVRARMPPERAADATFGRVARGEERLGDFGTIGALLLVVLVALASVLLR